MITIAEYKKLTQLQKKLDDTVIEIAQRLFPKLKWELQGYCGPIDEPIGEWELKGKKGKKVENLTVTKDMLLEHIH